MKKKIKKTGVRKLLKMRTDKRGISLIEVVVALALIALISASAFALVISSLRVENSAVRSNTITFIADDAYDCFRYAQDEEEFFSLLKKLNPDFVREGDSIVLKKEDFIIEINVEKEKKLLFRATDTDGQELYSYEFEKR